MLIQLLSLYEKIEAKKQRFVDAGLNGNFFIDVFRSQPFEPELYEYFSLPAIFVDYAITGNGKKQSRTIDLTLHVVTDEMPDASNISLQKSEGVKRFLYNLLLQEILEDTTLTGTNNLIFINEIPINEAVVNYHTQTYRFNAYLKDMIGNNPADIIGQFEKLNIYGSLNNNHFLNQK